MKILLEKFRYRGQKRIVIINAEKDLFASISRELKDVNIEDEIDPRYPYEFIIVFVKSSSEIEHYTPIALHNLIANGIIWYCYPGNASKYNSDIDHKNSWKILSDCGLYEMRRIKVDNNWSAVRFRNAKYVKSYTRKKVTADVR